MYSDSPYSGMLSRTFLGRSSVLMASPMRPSLWLGVWEASQITRRRHPWPSMSVVSERISSKFWIALRRWSSWLLKLRRFLLPDALGTQISQLIKQTTTHILSKILTLLYQTCMKRVLKMIDCSMHPRLVYWANFRMTSTIQKYPVWQSDGDVEARWTA